MRLVFVLFLLFQSTFSFNAKDPKVPSVFLDSRETYEFVELMPDEVDKFFESLTDEENYIWQRIYLQQLSAYNDHPDNTSFDELDAVASSVNAKVAQRMLEPRKAIFAGIAKLRNASATYVSEAYTAFRWMRMEMGDRVKVLKTILSVCEKGKALSQPLLDEIDTVFPAIPRYLQNPKVALLLERSKAMKIAKLYDEMVNESKRLYN